MDCWTQHCPTIEQLDSRTPCCSTIGLLEQHCSTTLSDHWTVGQSTVFLWLPLGGTGSYITIAPRGDLYWEYTDKYRQLRISVTGVIYTVKYSLSPLEIPQIYTI